MEMKKKKKQQVVVAMEESLLRLSIKEVIRFGYNRIKSCEFSHKYLKFQSNNKKLNLNLMVRGTHGFFHSLSYDYINCRFTSDAIIPTPTPLTLKKQPLLLDFIDKNEFQIVGSCDGLLLVVVTTPNVHGARAIYIWNPTTSEYKILPQLEPTPGSYLSKVYGFGRDPTTDNDYKVLFLETMYEEEESPSRSEFKVHLYSTHFDSWITLPNIPFHSSDSSTLSMKLAFANLHHIAEVGRQRRRPPCSVDEPWLADEFDGEFDDGYNRFDDSIISFDLKDDKFRVLPRPDFSGNILSLNTISAFNGGLGLFTSSGGSSLLCLWMMENFGKEDEHWAKKFWINNHVVIDNPSLSFNSVLHILQDGQILLTTWCNVNVDPYIVINPCVVCYNTNNITARILYQHVSKVWTSQPTVYVESLISPKKLSFQQRKGFRRCKKQAISSTSS